MGLTPRLPFVNIQGVLINILFNASQCGLGPNGGSKTIIRCAETLQDMGHYVTVLADINNYSWHKPKCIIARPWHNIKADVVICVSIWDVDHTINIPIDKKFWYMRGWEKWLHGEQYLIDQIKKFVNAGGRIIVNSSWLINQLREKCGVESVLCFSGLDVDFWKSVPSIRYSIPTVGYMKYERHKTKRSDLMDKINEERSLLSIGTMEIDIKGNDKDIDLRRYYSSSDMFFLPSELEGFSQVGAEASLCGNLLICNRMPSNGMGDYATDDTAMRYDTCEELIECIENPDYGKVKKMQVVLKYKIGSREKNMARLVELIG